ncbi:hypothetical protein TWF281_002432 [Arthrobotrys megalospora]
MSDPVVKFNDNTLFLTLAGYVSSLSFDGITGVSLIGPNSVNPSITGTAGWCTINQINGNPPKGFKFQGSDGVIYKEKGDLLVTGPTNSTPAQIFIKNKAGEHVAIFEEPLAFPAPEPPNEGPPVPAENNLE